MAKSLSKEVIDLSRLLIQVVCDKFERNYIAESSPVHLSKNQFTILHLLFTTSPLPISQIADILQISRAAASKSIDDLVRKKLVRRQVPRKDRRSNMVYLLDSGRNIVQKFLVHFNRRQRTIHTGMSREELQTLVTLLRKFVGLCVEQEKDISLICVMCNGIIRESCGLIENQEVCRYFYKQTQGGE